MLMLYNSVANPHHSDDADPDPTFHFDVDPDTACHFEADPDPGPTFHFNADPDPSFKKRRKNLERSAQIGSYSIHFGLPSAN